MGDYYFLTDHHNYEKTGGNEMGLKVHKDSGITIRIRIHAHYT
jgi:hypothetical protein